MAMAARVNIYLTILYISMNHVRKHPHCCLLGKGEKQAVLSINKWLHYVITIISDTTWTETHSSHALNRDLMSFKIHHFTRGIRSYSKIQFNFYRFNMFNVSKTLFHATKYELIKIAASQTSGEWNRNRKNNHSI